MQKILNTITILIAVYLLLNVNGEIVGGVRTNNTGFWLDEGENIAIGTSTPNLADIHIYRTATSSIAIDGTVMGCILLRDKTTNNLEYYISNNQEWATTSAADCGF